MFIRSQNLQDMCLISVIREIDFFVYNKTIPQKQIDFLFRVYSDELFAKHKALRKSIDEDCMIFFLNPHVKRVILLYKNRSKRIVLQLKKIGSGITSLNLHGSKATENELKSIICSLPHVVHLDLTYTVCSNETLKYIYKSCPNLESLNVSRCHKITGSGLTNLCGGKLALKCFIMDYLIVSPISVAKLLNNMPSLECLRYDKLDHLLCDYGYKEKYNLTELEYYGSLFNNDDAGTIQAWSRMCPNLKKLHFFDSVDKTTLRTCTLFHNLEELKIKMNHESYDYVRMYDVLNPILPISKNLKTLILSCVKISVVTLVECFEGLKNLYLKKVSFKPFKMEEMKVAKTNLLTLVIKDVDMKVHDTYEAYVLLISLSKNVTKLRLNHIQNLPSEMLDTILESMKNLTLMDFSHTPIINELYLNPFFQIPSMTTVIAFEFLNEEEIPEDKSHTVFENTASTLSWRFMHEFDSSSDDDDDKSENSDKMDDDDDYIDCDSYFYASDSAEDDVISDVCHSFDSEINYDEWYD